jgi:DNA invertase Pin-like site-specific DNA recombinase
MARRTTAVNGNEAILYVRVSTADQVEMAYPSMLRQNAS